MELPTTNQRKLAARHSIIKYRFILAELDLAITFCDVALTSDDREKTKRNTDNAHRAYDAARHFLENADFSDRMKAKVAKKVAALKTLLGRIESRRYDFAARNIAGAP
jgi:hypothetical protein